MRPAYFDRSRRRYRRFYGADSATRDRRQQRHRRMVYPGTACVGKTSPIGRADAELRQIAREAKPRIIAKRTAPETCKELDALPKT